MSVRRSSHKTIKKHNYARVDSIGFGEDSNSDLETMHIVMHGSGKNDQGRRELKGDNLFPEASNDNVVPTTAETFGALSQLSAEQLAEELVKAQTGADRLSREEKAKDNILALMQLQRDNLLKAVSIKNISTRIEDLAKGNTTISSGTLQAQVHQGQGQRIEPSHPVSQQSSNSVNIKTIRDRVRSRVDRAIEYLGMEDTDGDTDTDSESKD